ncbi:unnamed protein product [Alternaria burnsii]|nr:unnamed protein product [Alternaria burnsii]
MVPKPPPPRPILPEFHEERNEARLEPRGGQDEADENWYKERVQGTVSKKDIVRGFNTTYAAYEEAEFFAINWMIKNNTYSLDFGKSENLGVRGELIDALEISSPFFQQRVYRAWRDHATRGFITTIRNQFKENPALSDLSSARKRQRYDLVKTNGSPRKRSGPAQKTPLAFCKIVVQHHWGSLEKDVIFLRDLIDDGQEILNLDMNLNIEAVTYEKLVDRLEQSDIIRYVSGRDKLYGIVNKVQEDVEDHSDFHWVLYDAHPTDGVYTFLVHRVEGYQRT